MDITDQQIHDVLKSALLYANMRMKSEKYSYDNTYCEHPPESESQCICGKPEHKLFTHSTHAKIHRREDGETFEFSSFYLPSIFWHGFYGHEHSDYKIDPEEVKRFFSMEKDVDYSLKKEVHKTWKMSTSSSHTSPNDLLAIERFKNFSLLQYPTDKEGVYAFLFPSWRGAYEPKERYVMNDNFLDNLRNFLEAFKTETTQSMEAFEKEIQEALRLSRDYLNSGRDWSWYVPLRI